MSLARALEIATDFVDAAGEEHPIVRQMIAANDAVSGTTSRTWRESLAAPFPEDHAATVVALCQDLTRSMGMPWKPPPHLLDP